MTTKKKRNLTISLGIIVAFMSIIIGSFTVFNGICNTIDRHITKIAGIEAKERIVKLDKIQNDINEIKLILNIIYADDLKFKKAIEIVKNR